MTLLYGYGVILDTITGCDLRFGNYDLKDSRQANRRPPVPVRTGASLNTNQSLFILLILSKIRKLYARKVFSL